MSGRDTCQRTELVKTLTSNYCAKKKNKLEDFLVGKGGAKIKKLFPTKLEKYSKSDIGNSLDTIRAQLSRAAAMNDNKLNTENTNNNHNDDETMGSPDLAYYSHPPVESPLQPEVYTPKKRRLDNGSSYTPTSQRKSDMPTWTPKSNLARKAIRGARTPQSQHTPQRNDDTSTADLTSMFESATVSMPELRSSTDIISKCHLSQSVVEFVTDKQAFMDKARIACTSSEAVEQVDNIRKDQNSLASLMTEHKTEETNRDKDIIIVDGNIEHVTEAIQDLDIHRAKLVSKLNGLKKKKEEKMTEKDLVLGQVEALFNLGTHACSTLRKCVNFRLKQGDDVKKEATELAGEHVDMQQSYKLGGVEEYDKINKLQSSVDGGMFYT